MFIALFTNINVYSTIPLQLLPHWEKTFHIDLSSPQIGIVDTGDVSTCVNTIYFWSFTHRLSVQLSVYSLLSLSRVRMISVILWSFNYIFY